MHSKGRLILFVTAFAVVFGFLTITAPLSAASKEKVLYKFTGGADGSQPSDGSLIFDAAGNLYGMTAFGGGSGCYGYGCGTVFQLAQGTDGRWKEKVLYSFSDNGTAGHWPYGGLILDAAGNLYGTTGSGGGYGCKGMGCGTVFQLTPRGNGKWKEKVLHSFGRGQDGWWSEAGLIFDAAGRLYGTTTAGGDRGLGTVFQLVLGTDGKWAEEVLHSFDENGKDGYGPTAGLIFDAAGNLYGTTFYGGAHGSDCHGAGCGTVFQLTPRGNGKWKEKVLHSFDDDGKDGFYLEASLIFDAAGNLYGTTSEGGECGYGTVFQLTPGTNGKWTERVLHSFNQNGTDGFYPIASLAFDTAGNLYGTTTAGGDYGYGTVFQLTPGTNGEWKEKVLRSFSGKDGISPYAGLIFDAAENLYGTTRGGTDDAGIVFEITP